MQQIKKLFFGEIITAIFLIVLLSAFLYPTDLLMPKSMEMIMLVLFVLASLIFLALIWKERAIDEREQAHQRSAGRISFFVGSSMLTVGIISQALHHNIDPWLIITLGIMILTKIIVRIYDQVTH